MNYGPLGLVQLAMAVEEAFRIYLPEEDAARITSLRELKRYLWGRVPHARAPAPCLTQACFYRLRREICDLLGLKRRQIRPSTSWNSLLPKRSERPAWEAIRKTGALPRERWRLWFRIPGLLGSALLVGGGLALPFALVARRVPWSTVGLLSARLVWRGLALGWASRVPYARPRFRTTVGESARLLAAKACVADGSRTGPWTYDEVGLVVERLAMDAANAEDLNETAGFSERW